MSRFLFWKKKFQQSPRLGQPPPPPVVKTHAKKVHATVLYVELTEPERWIQSVDLHEMMKIFDQFYEISKNLVQFYGGTKYSNMNSSLLGFWEHSSDESISAENAWKALRSALQMRDTLSQINKKRFEMGQALIQYEIGIHQGPVLVYGQWVLGDVIQAAQCLSQIAKRVHSDLVISQECRNSLGTAIEAQKLGDASLALVSPGSSGLSGLKYGLTAYYGVTTYQDTSGMWVAAPPFFDHTPVANDTSAIQESAPLKTHQWFVRCVGSENEKMGPLTEQEIADLLFAQSLDFNCECWMPTNNQVSTLQESGIFKNLVENPNLSDSVALWVYDTKTVSGPMTLEILKTATQMGILTESSYVCEQSTAKGWVLLQDYLSQKALTAATAQALLSPLQDDPAKWKRVA